MALDMDNYIQIPDLDSTELRRLQTAIMDLCNNTGFHMGKVAIRHPEEESTLLVDFRKFLMALETASDTLQVIPKSTHFSKDQLAFDF
jgi:hypothetical protein